MIGLLCALFTGAGALACSTHGTNAGSGIQTAYGGDPSGTGRIKVRMGLDSTIVEPTAQTTCVLGVGLGSNARPLPAGVAVTAAQIEVVDLATGETRTVEAFRFSPDQETTTGMAAGSGGSGATDPRPLFAGATWFGFSSTVDPFRLELGAGETARIVFELEVPAGDLPLLVDVQVAAGEGNADGSPIFDNDHPVTYFTGVAPLVTLSEFLINAGLNDAWFFADTDGQGFLVIVFPDIGLLFVAWFTYDVERPASTVAAKLGEPGHRWLTASGPYAGNRATLDITVTRGGVFDAPVPAPERNQDGWLSLDFQDCEDGMVSYHIPSLDLQGVIPIRRVVADNIRLCEELRDVQ